MKDEDDPLLMWIYSLPWWLRIPVCIAGLAAGFYALSYIAAIVVGLTVLGLPGGFLM